MKKTIKRLLASFMVAVMVLTAAPLSSFVGLKMPDFGAIFSTKAEAATYSGRCGDDLIWTFDESIGELNISGTGDMYDGCQWYKYLNRITSVVINDGVTSIGNEVFRSGFNIKDIYIGAGVKTIGQYAFASCENLEKIVIGDSVNTVGKYAFNKCCGLKSVWIPKGIKEIGDGAFRSYTDSVKNVYYAGSEKDWNYIVKGPMFMPFDENIIIHYNFEDSSAIPDDFTESIKIGADRFTFGQDMTGTAGDTLNALLVYTSKENDINDLTITSSNTSVATVGTPNIDKGDYITGENELRATLPITLKSSGTATITVTAPDGTSASILVDVYASTEDSQEVKAYINEHISFANSNRYANLTTNASFYNSIWKHEEGSRNFTRYAAWDVIGRVGKFAALDFYGAFQTDNPYDVLLADVFSNYVNNEYGKSAKVFENTAKTILGAPSTFNNVLDVLKTSDAWNSELTETWKDFTDDTQKGWIDGIFLKSETFKLNDYDPAVKDLYNALTKIFKGMTESDFEKIFKGLKNTDTIFDYIGTGADMVFRFFDAYQKYLLAEALCETNEYILSSVESIARQEMSEENGKLLLDALDPYWSACYTDSAFEIVNEFAAEHGFIWSGVDMVYTYIGKGCLKEFIYAAIHSVTGIALDALSLTYNLTYLCLDYLSGLGKLDETHTLMNAAALLEKEYLELVKKEANELKSDATLENAAMFDTAWGFLQSLEGYCYKTLGTYTSAMKKEYTTNYVIKNSVSNNLFYTLISTNQLIKDLSACDSGIQSAVYLESEWVNSNCHNGVYSPSNLMAVKCPTDVYVYDSKGNLALSIVGNKVTLCKSNIVAFVDDDEKIFVLPTDQKYDIKITATDDGTMQYSVQCFNNLELLRTVIYDDIELTENKSYTGSIPTDNSAKTDDFNLKSETGTEIKADYDSAAKLQSGTCGDDLTWTFNESTGTLTISGTGTMYDYENYNRPWEDYEDIILSVVIEDSVKSIGDCAFYDCDGLSVVTIGNSVTSIGYCAFHHCDSLISVTIPDSVTFINSYAFSACVSLTSITIPDGVTSINQSTFSSCKNLKSIIIPDSVTEIHAFSFNYCDALETVIIGNGVTKIHDYAFSHSTGLKNLKLGNSVESIGSSAFQDCSSLISVVIPDTVTDVLFDSFADCSALTEVTIGKSVSSIAHGAFLRCDSLADVYYNGTEVEWNEILIGFSNEPLLDATIHFLGEGICDHSYTAKVTPPTCTEQGYTTYTCTGCGYSYKDNFVAALGTVHSVSIDNISLDYKSSTTITPSINADSGVKYTVSYSSSNDSVVSVDQNGKITTRDTGSATITVTIKDEYGNTVSDTCNVEVKYTWWQWIIVIVLFGWIWY